MKAVQIESFGDPAAVVRAVDLPDPEPPAEDEALLAVEASPINPSDLAVLRGIYGQLPKLPAVPGGEGVGRVLAVGPGVTKVAVGDRVLLPIGIGAWREKLKTRAASLMPVPAAADALQLSMATVNPPTAYLLLSEFVELKQGDWVIQNVANSGVGQYLIQFAKAQGLRTVNVVRRAELKDDLVSLGADAVVMDGPDLKAQVEAATQGAPIALGIDAVAGAATGRLAECLTDAGTIVNYGAMSGEPCKIGASSIIFRDIHLRGFWLAAWHRKATPEARQKLMQRVIEQLGSGAVKVDVEATYPFERVAEAVKRASEGGRNGKVFLVGSGR
jgi:mitochondrial enoyl-[acyl-carrier protein] reductase / trans-2-enoyl-CoA reductase